MYMYVELFHKHIFMSVKHTYFSFAFVYLPWNEVSLGLLCTIARLILISLGQI